MKTRTHSTRATRASAFGIARLSRREAKPSRGSDALGPITIAGTLFGAVTTAVLLTLATAACGRLAPVPAPQPRNAILVVVDTLRADHLSAYGYFRSTSPTLDRLAAQSVLFESAYSQAACTFPSANSLLTSRPAPLFWHQPPGELGIAAGVPTLAEVLQARGYSTLAVSASPIVRKSPTRFNPQGGFDRGFDIFDEQCLWRDARCVARRAHALLDQVQSPFFAYLHFMDPHGPYRPPPEHQRRFALAYSGAHTFIAEGEVNQVAEGEKPGAQPVPLTAEDRAHLQALYDDEIAWWDERFGDFVQQLAARGTLDDTVLILTSDHGEAFLEHGHSKHCRSVFEEEIHVPMLIRAPGITPRRVASPVENLDVAPTLLALLGLPPEPAFSGQNLAALLRGEVELKTASSAQGSLRALVDGRKKLILDLANGRLSLYDLAADPGETRDLAPEQPEEVRRLARTLRTRMATSEADVDSSREAARQADQMLRSLGYLE